MDDLEITADWLVSSERRNDWAFDGIWDETAIGVYRQGS